MAARTPRAASSSLLPILPAVLMVYAALLPDEVRVVIGGQYVYATRLIGLALLPWLARHFVRRSIRFNPADWMILAAGAWMVISFLAYYGFAKGANRAVAITIDVLIPYFVARCSMRSVDDFRRLLIAIAPGVLVSGLAMLAETLAGRELIRPAFARLFGALPDFAGGGERRVVFVDYRWGLLRVAGPFSQPIVAGAFMASCWVLYLSARLRSWPLYVGMAAVVFAFLSLSSSSLFIIAGAIALLAADFVQKRTPLVGWPQIVTVIVLVAGMIQAVSNRGLLGIAAAFSFNPETAYFRRLTWQYATVSVAQNPWFGIGFTPYQRPAWMRSASVDHYWLALALRNGLPAMLLLFLVSVLAVVAVTGAASRASTTTQRNFCVGFAISLSLLIASEFTYSLFGVMLFWHYFLVGSAISLASLAPKRTG